MCVVDPKVALNSLAKWEYSEFDQDRVGSINPFFPIVGYFFWENFKNAIFSMLLFKNDVSIKPYQKCF